MAYQDVQRQNSRTIHLEINFTFFLFLKLRAIMWMIILWERGGRQAALRTVCTCAHLFNLSHTPAWDYGCRDRAEKREKKSSEFE